MGHVIVATSVASARKIITVTPAGGYDAALRDSVYRLVPSGHWVNGRNRWELPQTFGALCRIAALCNDGVNVQLDLTVGKLLAAAASAVRPPADDSELPFESPTHAWRHQRAAWRYLAWARENLGSALLDCGMRTGKTRMILDHFRGLARPQRCAVIFCPKIVVSVWPEQADLHCAPGELRVVPVERGKVADRVRTVAELLKKRHIAVVGWSVLERMGLESKRELRAAIASAGATVVADEVHYAKAAGSSRSKTLALISQDSPMRIGASGTPLAHSPLDAYGVFRFLDPGVWGNSYVRFRDQYANMGGYGQHTVTGYKNLEELAARMRPYTFRATRDVLDLPPVQDITITIDLPKDALELYKELKKEAVAELKSGTLIVGNALAKMMRLAQLASGYLPAADDSGGKELIHNAKRDVLRELLESCDPREPWVVFGRFRHDLAQAHEAATLCGRPSFELSGETKQLAAWKAAAEMTSGLHPNGPVLCAQIQAGGIGVDMTQAAFCCYLSKGYSLAEYEQSRARVHGPDQKRPVGYYHIEARGTVDIDIRKAIAKRADVLRFVADALMSGM